MNRQVITALTACGGALAYTASKVMLAIHGELGIHGFPAPPGSYAGWQPGEVGPAQMGNAAVGLVAAACALALTRPHRLPRAARRILLGASWLGIAGIGAGVVGFSLRAFGLAPALGPPAAGWSTYVALGVGAAWVGAWVVATVRATRTARQVRSATPPRAGVR